MTITNKHNISIKNFFLIVQNLLDKNTFEIAIAYKFAILTIFGFFVSIFFNPLIGTPSQDSVFYINALGATLCLMFILGELWIPGDPRKILSYVWFLILSIALLAYYFKLN
jgi:hypothetical protein